MSPGSLEPGLQSRHAPLKPPVPLLLLQLVAPGPAGHSGLCHLWLHISAAPGEGEPLLSLFPLTLNQNQQKEWRFLEKQRKEKQRFLSM